MMLRSRMVFSLLGLALFCTACEMQSSNSVATNKPRSDKKKPTDPQTYPGWAYDKPESVKPNKDLSPQSPVRPNEPLHYFTHDMLVMVRQPSNYKADETPRVALWWTDDNGSTWNKAGYFGRSQSYFPLKVEKDGDYGVRFVGPGQEVAVQTPAQPERVYHVDTTKPSVTLTVSPKQTWYNVGDTVAISWKSTDFHLNEYPVRVGVFKDFSSDQKSLAQMQVDLTEQGAIQYTIPADALNHELSFRAEAEDRAGNVGLVYSYPLQVLNKKAPPPTPIVEQKETQVSSKVEVKKPTPVQTTDPIDDWTAGLEPAPARLPAAFTFDPDCDDATPADDFAVTSETPDEFPPCDDVNDSDTKVVSTPKYPNFETAIQSCQKFTPFFQTAFAMWLSRFETSDLSAAPTEDVAIAENLITPTPTQYAETYSFDANMMTADGVEQDSHCLYLAMLEANATAQMKQANDIATASIATKTKAPAKKPVKQQPSREVVAEVQASPLASGNSGSVPFATAISRQPDSKSDVIWHDPAPVSTLTPKTTVATATPTPAKVTTQTSTPQPTKVTPPTEPSSTAVATVPAWTSSQHPLSTKPLKRGSITSLDLTHGNGLMIPMPATVEEKTSTMVATAHPWWILGDVFSSKVASVWQLPGAHAEESSFARSLADNPAMRFVAEPAGGSRALVGIPANTVEKNVDNEP